MRANTIWGNDHTCVTSNVKTAYSLFRLILLKLIIVCRRGNRLFSAKIYFVLQEVCIGCVNSFLPLSNDDFRWILCVTMKICCIRKSFETAIPPVVLLRFQCTNPASQWNSNGRRIQWISHSPFCYGNISSICFCTSQVQAPSIETKRIYCKLVNITS